MSVLSFLTDTVSRVVLSATGAVVDHDVDHNVNHNVNHNALIPDGAVF